VDGSEASMSGLREALKIVKSQGSKLRILHIVNEFILDYSFSSGVYAEDVIESLRKGGKSILGKAEAVAQCEGVKPECVLLESIGGRASDLILAQASEWSAELIVMGTHGRRGLARAVMGSDAEGVLRGSSVPVLLVRAGQDSAAERRTGKASAA